MTRRCFSLTGARNLLIGQCREAGSVARFAALHGLSRKHLDAIIDGEVELSAPVAIAIGLQRMVIFTDHAHGRRVAAATDSGRLAALIDGAAA